MARSKMELGATVDDELSPAVADRLNQVQNEAATRLAGIVAQFGDGLAFEPRLYEEKIKGHLSRSAAEMLAAGRALVVAREHLPHGDWRDFLGRVGMDVTLAKRMCQAAIKFSNGATSHHLIESVGSKSKVFELMVLDDDDIQELNDGGTVAGLDLDDISRMPVSELRKALRDARDEKKATDQLLTEKNSAIDRLRSEVTKTKTRITTTPPDQVAEQLRVELSAQAHGAEHAIRQNTRAAIEALMQHAQEHGGDPRAVVTGFVAQLQQALDDIRAEFALGTVAPATPEWATEQ